MHHYTVVGSERFELGEGARWIDGRLVFVDILKGRLLELRGDAVHELVCLGIPLGAVAPMADRPGTWIAAAGAGVALIAADGTLEWLARPE